MVPSRFGRGSSAWPPVKNVRHLEELTAEGGRPSGTSARTLNDVIGGIVNHLRLIKWCHDAEQGLDSGTKFLHDNWNQLSDEDRESLEDDLAGLLNSYAESC